MSLFSKIPRKKLISMITVGLFLFMVGVASAATLSLQADYSCDNITDLDDYTILVREKRLSTRKISLLFKEWGKRGISDLAECEGRAVTSAAANIGGSDSVVTTTPVTTTVPATTNSPTTTTSPATTTAPVTTTTPAPVVTTTNSIDLSDPNLVAYFPMEESSGALINKKTSNSVANLIPQGTVSYSQPGKLGKGIKVGGVGNAFCSGTGSNCSDVKLYDFTESYTMGMWVKHNGYEGFLFRKWEEGAGNYSYWGLDSNIFIAAVSHPHPDWLYGYGHGLRKGQPTGRGYIEGYMELTQGATDGWHHMVVVRDTTAKTVHLYVDGVKQDTHPGVIQQANGSKVTATMRADNQASSDPFRLGELNGVIDDFFAYDKALTEAEIKEIYQEGL
jgi:hypothetical protein